MDPCASSYIKDSKITLQFIDRDFRRFSTTLKARRWIFGSLVYHGTHSLREQFTRQPAESAQGTCMLQRIDQIACRG